jgi:hypothetical protein
MMFLALLHAKKVKTKQLPESDGAILTSPSRCQFAA